MTVLNYSTRAMEDKIRLVLERARFDAIQIESIHLGVYLRAIRDKAPWARLIMDWHNIESELMARYARFCANPLRSAVAKRTARQLLTMEIEVLQLVDLLFVTSPRELEVVRNGPWHPRCLLQSIENGVTCEDFIDEGSGLTNASETTRRNLIFVGSMDYHANVDAVTWFAHEVWPLVNARFPAVTFKIIGRRPAAAVKQLAMVHGIEVVGEVREVRPFYAAALAAVVPLRTGGGTRLKILEAMAAGVPVVSTRVGAEGLAVEDGRHFLMADSPPALANAIGRIVTDQELGRRLVKQARQLVLERYDWRAIGSGLREAYASLGFLDARRL